MDIWEQLPWEAPASTLETVQEARGKCHYEQSEVRLPRVGAGAPLALVPSLQQVAEEHMAQVHAWVVVEDDPVLA